MSFEFHETVRGARFYDGQIPRLVDAMERIADSLEKLVEQSTSESETDPDLESEKPQDHPFLNPEVSESITRPPFSKKNN